MSTRKKNLSKEEIAAAFGGPNGDPAPPILTPNELAKLLGQSVKTIYYWIAEGRLHGAFRKRGKHVLIWRDRALEIIFNEKDW